MDIVVTLMIGGVIGWIAGSIMGTGAQMGMIVTIAVGIVGSFVGDWLSGAAGVGVKNNVVRWAMSVIGAVTLIAVLRAANIFN